MSSMCFLLIVAIAATCSQGLSTEQAATCPHEVEHLNLDGYRTPDGDCVTFVSLQQLRKKKISSKNETLLEQIKAYCETEFTNGSLILHYTTKNGELVDVAELLVEAEESNISALLSCTHKPYANCQLKINATCVLDVDNHCILQYTVDSIIPAEQPYGKECGWQLQKTSCECSPCLKTQWESWMNYTLNGNQKLRTRYRPHDKTPFHLCSANSAFCCGEFHHSDNLARAQIGCLNGGLISDVSQFKCSCPLGYTGIFCELEATSGNGANIFFKMTNQDSNVLLWLLLWCAFITLTLAASKTIKCFRSIDKQKRCVVINVHRSDQQNKQNQQHFDVGYSEEEECNDDLEMDSYENSRFRSFIGSIRSRMCRCNGKGKKYEVTPRMIAKRSPAGPLSIRDQRTRKIIYHL